LERDADIAFERCPATPRVGRVPLELLEIKATVRERFEWHFRSYCWEARCRLEYTPDTLAPGRLDPAAFSIPFLATSAESGWEILGVGWAGISVGTRTSIPPTG